MTDYALGCRTRYLTLAPMIFWGNSELLKKEHFSCPKNFKTGAFLKKLAKNSEISQNVIKKSFKY